LCLLALFIVALVFVEPRFNDFASNRMERKLSAPASSHT
jgi:hypothetical protein